MVQNILRIYLHELINKQGLEILPAVSKIMYITLSNIKNLLKYV